MNATRSPLMELMHITGQGVDDLVALVIPRSHATFNAAVEAITRVSEGKTKTRDEVLTSFWHGLDRIGFKDLQVCQAGWFCQHREEPNK